MGLIQCNFNVAEKNKKVIVTNTTLISMNIITTLLLLLELGGMTKNVYHGIFLNYTGFTVYDGIFFSNV